MNTVEAGSAHSATSPGRDLTRAIVCALLVAACVASPGASIMIAPFVPALVALRLVRREPAGRFLSTCVAAAVVAAVLATVRDDAVIVAVLAAIVLTIGLGVVHTRAARLDPVDDPQQPEWPEPRLTSGFTPTVGAWLAASIVIIVTAFAAIGSTDVTGAADDMVRDAYRPYVSACGDDGALAKQDDLCKEFLAQRDDVLDVIDDHAASLLAVLAAIVALGAAATTHLIVLGRSRRRGERVRPRWRLAQLEVHWSAAYVAAAGFVTLLVVKQTSDGGEVVEAVAYGAVTLGLLAVSAQGFGFATWLIQRAPRPTTMWVLVVILIIGASPVATAICVTLGMLDMSTHPRRRALTTRSTPPTPPSP